MATLLVVQSRSLLVGEGIDKEMAQAMRQIVLDDPAVESAALPLTMHLGPAEVLVTLDMRFHAESSASQAGGQHRADRAPDQGALPAGQPDFHRSPADDGRLARPGAGHAGARGLRPLTRRAG
ncbi:hypothetical protein D9M72_346650 [compost metagenome]